MTRHIEMAIELRVASELVWRAISDASEMAKWLAPEVRITGERLFVSWGEGLSIDEPIARVEPGRLLRHRFGEGRDVEWTLEPKDGRTTTLRLNHTGFLAEDEELDSTRRGWRIFLANLRHYLEHHAGAPCGQRPFVLRVEADRDAVWRHIVSARGLDRDGTLGSVAPGAKYHLTTSRGRTLAGVVQILEPARDLALTVSDDVLLRLSLERTKDGTMVYGVVLAYGAAAGDAASLASDVESALRAALEKDPPLSVRRQRV
ncbi:MAG TPA: SRPBCC domain-containing protein [Labilithrix sp.]|jgi:uncharacterized protein YndB with AHSA1/START domain